MLNLLFTRLFAAAWRRHERRKAIRTLSDLNDRLLRDIGIERHDIEAVVHRTAFPSGPLAARHSRSGRRIVLPNGSLMNLSCCPAPGRG